MSIASRIESISENLENAYNSLENIGIDLAGINKNISNLSAQIESVYADLPKVTDTNAEITLNNTKKGKMELNLKGNTYQFTTTGKNKFAKVDGTQNHNGLETVVTQGNVFHIHGLTTAAENWFTLDITKMVLPAGTYTFSAHYDSGSYSNSATSNFLIFLRPHGGSSNIATLYPPNANNLIKEASFTIEEETAFDIYGYCVANLTFTNYVMKLQVESGSTATSYEPYTDGIASPNPNYPQDIKVVTGDNNIIIENKNIASPLTSDEINGITFTTNENGTTHISGTATGVVNKYSPFINKTLKAGTYTLSTNLSALSEIPENSSQLILVGNNDTRIATINLWLSTSKTFILSEDTFVKYYYFYCGKNFSYNADMSIQLEKADDATLYEKHMLQSYPIILGNLELCKIGNYQDYFYKNTIDATDYSSERTLNAWYLKKNINKVTFNGTENWDTQNSVFVLNVSDTLVQSYAGRTQIMLSDRFKGAITNYRGSLSNLCISKTIDNAKPHQIAIRYDDIISGGASSFKTWLSTHNTTAYYVLGTPIFTEITGTLATQLEALKNAKSYKNQTNISQTNNDVPFIISASALLQNSD